MPARSAHNARALAGRYSRSVSVFDAEMKQIFSRRWIDADRRTRIDGPDRLEPIVRIFLYPEWIFGGMILKELYSDASGA